MGGAAHPWGMGWMKVLAWSRVAVGVAGFWFGVRRSRSNDEVGDGLLAWVVVAWVGLVVLIGSEVA